jgi:hypothetical protein
VHAGKFSAAWIVVICLSSAGLAVEPRNVVRPVDQRDLPVRVHVFEDYETDIEKRWFMRGEAVKDERPVSLSASVPNRRSCRATETKDFDDKMGDREATYKAVIFNPVPGPPMGKHTRLSFRYRLHGTDAIRVQIYSLTNGYHRALVLTGLEQDRWLSATVDMTQARRPDGSGGALSADERIDDIQFYINRNADLWIDDIVLYEAAAPADDKARGEEEAFPPRIIFTGWFDTGKQGAGNEWPGRFEIVPQEPPRTWRAAHSIEDPASGQARLEISLRGLRRLSDNTRLRFRYRLTGANSLDVALVNNTRGRSYLATLKEATADRWSEASIDFQIKPDPIDDKEPAADAIHIVVRRQDAVLLVDDLLLYEPTTGK